MKDKKKNIIWKRIINKNFNKLINFTEKEQAKLNSFDKVKEWLNKQENLENLELLADVACQQKKLKIEKWKEIHWKKEIININKNLQSNDIYYIDLLNQQSTNGYINELKLPKI
ncbi:hypothetical protein [Spiroplasma endosymbiont of Danaus chrysippus]|uniref:hypothetical protein n=1 Tax=Spiroplasma endosymbiont of Danaus chrysippus TaxID=2691041 RepID=UPI00157A8019|nr:hypothetical protein [Spiroplasma endosymbiont of Danaus chrysippus]